MLGTTINSNTSTAIEVEGGAGPLAINAPLVLANDQQWINNSANPTAIGGNIGGGGDLTLIGGGGFILSGSSVFSGNLTADGGTVQLSSGYFFPTAGNEIVGRSVASGFAQSGGTNIASGNLSLGYNVGSPGAYNLSGGSLLCGNAEVGYLGNGSFAQSGGASQVSNLYLTYASSNSTGLFNLSGGSLYCANNEFVGTSGTGSFTQSGGTNSINTQLFLGWNTGSVGTYNLSGSGLINTFYEYVRNTGGGSFTQSGGTNLATANFGVGGFQGNGTYILTGSGRLASPIEYIGAFGIGRFTQSGGTNEVSAEMIFGIDVNGVGTYNLNGGLLTLSAGGMTQASGSISSSFNFGGGTLGALAPWSTSINLNVTGSGGNATIDTTGGNISLSGNLTGSGTLNKVGSGILLLSGTNSVLGSLIVDGGTVQIPAGSLTAATNYIGVNGYGTVMQTGGTNTISGALYLGVNPGSSGTYYLDGGLLVVPSILQGSGSASLNINGGTLTGGASGATVSAPIILTSSGSAGTFNTAVYSLIVASQISGSGGLIKTGTSSLVLTAANTYTGDTTINAGVVQLVNSLALQNTTVVLNVPNGLQFNSSLATGRGTVSIGGLSGGGSLTLSDSNGNPINVVITGNGDTTFSGTIGGNGGLVMGGSGSLDLSGSNSWTGGLYFDPGTVAFQSDAALGAASNPIIFNGSGVLQARGGVTLSASRRISIGPAATAMLDTQGYTLTSGGPISGAGGLSKLGSGTLVLCGSDSYSGSTSIAAGVLKLDFSQPGAPSANIINNSADSSSLLVSGGTLAVQGTANVANAQQFNGTTIGPGSSAIVLTAAAANSLLLSLGDLNRSPGGTVEFALPSGTQAAANGITTTTPNTSAGILGGYATVSGTDWAASSGAAGNITAYSAYTTGNLGSLTSNAVLNVKPTGPQTAITTADSFNTLNLTGTAGVVLSGSGSLTLVGGGIIGNTTGAISGGTLQGSPAGDLIIFTPQNLTIGGVIADNCGASGLTKAGSATLVLSGNNAYSGATTIGAGTLQVGNGGATGTLGTGAVADYSALICNRTGATTFAGAISGGGSLIKVGNGVLVLAASNDFAGGTTIGQGVVQLANSAALLNSTVAINADYGLQFGPGAGTYYLGGLSGIGLLRLDDTASGATGLVVGSNGAATTFAGSIGGDGWFAKSGNGTLVLSGSNTYNGGTSVNAGILQLGNGGTIGSLAGNITNNASLVFDRADNPTFAGAISGVGGLTQAGTGILTLAGSNSFGGGTMISSGAISLNNAQAVQNSTVTAGPNNGLLFNTNGGAISTFNVGGLAGGGDISLSDGVHSLTLSAGGNGAGTVYSGRLSGSGALTKIGTGTLGLVGGNTYLGTTTIAAGELLLDFSQSGAPAANIINNAANASSLTLAGGALVIQGNTSTTNSQRFNGMTINLGCSSINLTTAGTANMPLLLSLGGITRNGLGTVDFTLRGGAQSVANGITTTTPNTSAGILGAYATVDGTDWACSAGTNGAPGNITAYSAYANGGLGSLASDSSLNLLPNTMDATPVSSAKLFNTLNLTHGQSVNMTGTGSVTLAGGGVIGNTSGAISGGTLAGSAGGELVVITPASLTIGSVIADNGGPTALVKAGSDTLVLTGNNTYRGVTTIGAGTLQIGNAGNTGTLGTGAVVNNSALVFDLSGVSTFGGVIGGAGSITQSGDGILVLSGSNSYTGRTYVSAGSLYVTNSHALPDGTSVSVGSLMAFPESLVSSPVVSAASSSPAASPAIVPEPESATLMLFTAAVYGIAVYQRFCSRSKVRWRERKRGISGRSARRAEVELHPLGLNLGADEARQEML